MSEAMIDLRIEGLRGRIVGEPQDVAAANAGEPAGARDEQGTQGAHAPDLCQGQTPGETPRARRARLTMQRFYVAFYEAAAAGCRASQTRLAEGGAICVSRNSSFADPTTSWARM